MAENAQGEVHAQGLKEKAAREQLRGITVHHWPHDENGEPMAIVIGAGSDLTPTVQFGNVCVGPVTIMRPVKNDPETLAEEAGFVQDLANYVVGSRRRLLQWALDPSTRVEHPVTGEPFNPSDVVKTHPDETAAIVAAAPAGAVPSPGGETATGAPQDASSSPVTTG